jgi:hypothetical protein
MICCGVIGQAWRRVPVAAYIKFAPVHAFEPFVHDFDVAFDKF